MKREKDINVLKDEAIKNAIRCMDILKEMMELNEAKRDQVDKLEELINGL